MSVVLAEPKRLGSTALADGRRLGWAEWGPADGAPVIFCGGAGTGRSLGFGADVLPALGVRLIAVERPGLGVSDPLPGRTLADWPDDIAQVMTDLGLVDPRIVGFSQGAPFALACAAAGLSRKVAIVAGQDTLYDPIFANRIDHHLAGLLVSIATDPCGVEAHVSSTGTAEMLWGLISASSSPLDLGVYADPRFEPNFRRALDEGFAQGAAGYARDLVISMQPWPFDLSLIEARVHLWYGEQDWSTVHSPDRGETLARRLRDARRHLAPVAGGSILWTHARQILQALIS